MLLASTREGLANADTWKVLTKIQVSKSILQFATNCGSIWYMVYDAFHSKKGYALLMRTIGKVQNIYIEEIIHSLNTDNVKENS